MLYAGWWLLLGLLHGLLLLPLAALLRLRGCLLGRLRRCHLLWLLPLTTRWC